MYMHSIHGTNAQIEVGILHVSAHDRSLFFVACYTKSRSQQPMISVSPSLSLSLSLSLPLSFFPSFPFPFCLSLYTLATCHSVCHRLPKSRMQLPKFFLSLSRSLALSLPTLFFVARFPTPEVNGHTQHTCAHLYHHIPQNHFYFLLCARTGGPTYK